MSADDTVRSEYRLDPLTNRRVIIARGRSRRPHDSHGAGEKSSSHSDPSLKSHKDDCPFCLGNEDMTPPEVTAHRPEGGRPNNPGWAIRVVPNKFPALIPSESLSLESSERASESMGWFATSPAVGVHEVVIHDPDHSKGLFELGSKKVSRVLSIYRERLRVFAERDDLKYAVAVVNHGAEAGASLEHSHSQLFSTSRVPFDVATEVEIAESDCAAGRECRLCNIIKEERIRSERILGLTESHIAFIQFASRSPYQVSVAPTSHQSRFEDVSDEEIEDLGLAVWRSLGALQNVLGPVPYNVVLRTSPWGNHASEGYHWRLDIVPKLSIMAGFELGTGVFINIVPPEEAAAELEPRF